MMAMKEHLLPLILVVVVTVSAQRDTCKFENKVYNVGQIIQFLPDVCKQSRCKPNNVIDFETPFGPKAKKCCKCHNKLYLGKSKTCINKEETGRCPALCHHGGEKLAHGEILDTNLAKCMRRRCLDGKITDEHPVGKEKTGCCLETKGTSKTMIAHGTETTNGGGCVPETCINSGFVPSPTKIASTCKKCSVFNDPHFRALNGAVFDWHLGCNHALLQEGTKNDPDFGVFMDFNRRGSVGYISGPTTYQEDINTQVILTPGKTQVTVNGHHQDITSSSPKFLVGPGGIATTALAWKHGHCTRLYGKPKILVELCGSQISIWASPWNINLALLGIKQSAGLCGKTLQSSINKKVLVGRNGVEYPNPGTYRSADTNFGTSWKAAQQNKPECQAGGRRRKRDAQEDQTEKLRMDCQSVKSKDSPYLGKCLPVMDHAGLTGNDRANLLDACLFDLCIAATDPESPVTVDEMLDQHREIAAETKDQEENTVVVAAQTKCPTEWSLVGDQCYQVHRFREGLSFDDAREHCLSEKASLAQPRDLKATNNFLRDTIVALKDEGIELEQCPDGWSPVGDQCYQAHPFSEGLSFDDAQKHCHSQNASLAQPRDLYATKNFLRNTLQALPKKHQGYGLYWLGGQRKGGAMQWLIGSGVIPNHQFIFGRPREPPYNCLEMRPQLNDKFYAPLATGDCIKPEGYLCEKGMNLNGGAIQWLIGGGANGKPQNCLQLRSQIGNKNQPLTTLDCINPEGYICEKDTLACGDEDDECVWRAADGECDGNRAYMYNFCKASCGVSCDCDQPDTCTEVGGKCQPQGAKCDAVSDPSLCSGDTCTCCYVPDQCQDAEDQDCQRYVEAGLCDSEDDYILEEIAKICSLSCGFCEPY